MVKVNTDRQQYFELEKHSVLQHIIFNIIFAVLIVVVFSVSLPFIEEFIVQKSLQGDVIRNGSKIPISLEDKNDSLVTGYYNSWAIDIYKKTNQESRYWFNPILSLSMPIILFSFWLALVISSIMPLNIGLIRHKIEREIINQIDRIFYAVNGYYADSNEDIINEILNADSRELHSLSNRWKIIHTDMKLIQKVLRWQKSNTLYKTIHPWTGLGFYLRFYFTDKYSNLILGLVYIGAAVLIIIIGLRGLKFIPSSQPSLVFFALGLEFSVLLTYALTVMYSRTDSESEVDKKNNEQKPNLSLDFGSSKEVENLLRAFLKAPKFKGDNKKEKN